MNEIAPMRILFCCQLYAPSVGGVQEVIRQIADIRRRFSDAEVATLIGPRRLIGVADDAPKVPAQPESLGRRRVKAPGQLTPPDEGVTAATRGEAIEYRERLGMKGVKLCTLKGHTDIMATPEAIRELLNKMADERDALLSQAEALSDEAASYAPADGEGEAQWSPKQQLAHLAEMETAYRAWVQRALDDDDPDVTGVTGAPPAIRLIRAQVRSTSELADQLRAERLTTLALISSMSPEQFERKASQPMFGSLTVMQWLRSYYRHDRMHRDQMAGRDPSYKPKFVGGNEPDQRRGGRI